MSQYQEERSSVVWWFRHICATILPDSIRGLFGPPTNVSLFVHGPGSSIGVESVGWSNV